VATEPDFNNGFHAVVLAAGSATRFGGRKLLADWNGAPLLHAALKIAQAAPVQSLTVVTGADAGEVADCVQAFDAAIRLVHAPDHAEGMAASLRAGIASLPEDAAGAFVFLGDMPRAPKSILRPLAEAVRAGAAAAAPAFRGRRGNPVILGRGLFPAVAAMRGDTGARALLQTLDTQLALIESPDDGVLFDVDTPGDLARPASRP
jgi:molybdenum cofactor cytidylyltransferase